MEQDAIVRIRNLNKTFTGRAGKVTALDGIDLDINRGEIFGIIGLSGAGKSTLVRCINFLETPTAGTVTVDGQELGKLSKKQLLEARRSMGMIFQQFNLLQQRTALQNICFPLEIAGVSRADAVKRATELLEIVGLSDRAGNYPSQLSGGQQQRVAIARALVKMPHVLLLDEPLSNLDARLRLQTREEIRRIQRETKITTIFVTHDQEEAMSICDLIAVMKDGILQQLGKPQDVYDFPSNLFVAKFLGTPPINVFHGFVKNQTLFIGKNAVLATPGVSDQEVTAGIRPEGLIYRPDGPLSCHMNRIEVMGRDTSITASHPDCENPVIRAITNTDKLPDPSARTVSFSLKPGKVHLFQAETGERIPFSTNHEVNSYE